MTVTAPDRPKELQQHPYHRELELKALYEVNQYLLKKGRPTLSKMPPGIVARSNLCPISEATGIFATYRRTRRKIGPNAELFAKSFDRGNFPELIRAV